MKARSPLRYRTPAELATMPPHGHFVVEASAGTGKTFLIEHRVVDLLIRTDVTIEQILVVTFTEKATAELRMRIRRLLSTLVGADQDTATASEPHWLIDDDVRGRLAEALMSFDRAPIFTIHGFCHRTLSEHAFTGGRLLEQTQIATDAAFGDAFRSELRENFAVNYSDYLSAWLDTHHDVDKLKQFLYTCAIARTPLDPPYRPGPLSAILDQGETTAALSMDALETSLLADKVGKRTVGAVLRRWPAVETTIAQWISDKSLPLALARLGKQKDLLYLRDAIAKAPSLGPLSAWLAALCDVLVPLKVAIAEVFLPAVVQRMEADKARLGQFDFNDMLALVWRGLSGPGGDQLTLALRNKYRFALIDEFQDTDELQWKIFRHLYVGADSRVSLSIIGDPKQAIYSFRGADVVTYLQACDELVAAGGQRVTLKTNYRSTKLLVSAYNKILAPEGASFFSGGISYSQPVEAGASVVAVDGGGVAVPPIEIIEVGGEDKLSAGKVRDVLLADIAGRISAILGDPQSLLVGKSGEQQAIGAGDIFVLTRSIAESNDIAAALRSRGVPCALFKQEGLFHTDEASEVRDLLAAIANPRSQSARFAAWSTRFFAVPLAALRDVADIDDSHPLVARLYDWRSLAERQRFDELFAAILEDSGVIERELVLATSERSLTNFVHIFELLADEVNRSRCELSELVHRFGTWMSSQSVAIDDHDVQRLESDDDAVQIMTVHKSKGLEAAVVFLYGGLGRPPSSDVRLYHEGKQRRAFIGPASADVTAQIEAESAAENERLLYVAMTRAVAKLYLPYVPDAVLPNQAGYYAHLNRRLGDLLAANDSAVVSASPIADSPASSPAVAQWKPPPELLLDDAPDPAFATARALRSGYIVTSYTRLKHQDDDATGDKERIFDAPVAPGDGELPGGAASGILLHEILELLPYHSARDVSFEQWCELAEVRGQFDLSMKRHRCDRRYLAHSMSMVWNAISSPLALSGQSLPALASSVRDAREVEFLYPIPGDGELGYIKGFIDLVFEVDGRVYVLDWKSDLLADYSPATVREHVEAHYRLQAELYSIALARMLDGDHERFGGLIYSFLRGVGRGDHGLYFERPSPSSIERRLTSLSTRTYA